MSLRLAGLTLILLGGFAQPALPQSGRLYRHVDANGVVVYSDRPNRADQLPEKKRSANVASPEATRQYEIERLDLLRRRREEELIVMRARQAAAREAARTEPVRKIYSGRYDPNLPDSPPPDSERRYYYGNR